AAWVAQLWAVWLVGAAAGAALWSAAALRRRDGWLLVAAAALWLPVGLAAGAQLRLGEIARDWPAVQRAIETEAGARLNAALGGLVDRGERAVSGAAALVPSGTRPTRTTFGRLAELRRSTGVSAVAVLDRRSAPVAWAGEHRGAIPPEVLSAAQ